MTTTPQAAHDYEALMQEYLALSEQWSPYRRASDRDAARMKVMRELLSKRAKKENAK